MSGNVFIGVTVIGSPGSNVAHARHAEQLRLAVDLGAARAAATRLAVPAHREIGLLLRLDLVDGVEDDHAGVGLDLVLLELAAALDLRVGAPDPELVLRALRRWIRRPWLLLLLQDLLDLVGHRREAAPLRPPSRCRPRGRRGSPSRTSLSISGIVLARVAAAALLAERARERAIASETMSMFRRSMHLVPAGVVVAVAAGDLRARDVVLRGARARSRHFVRSSSLRMMPT